MKRISLFSVLLIFLFISCNNDHLLSLELENDFLNPPDNIRVGVYWYWINDNISKEAVIADLHAMKKAGITRAYIGNIGKLTYPWGNWKNPAPPYGNAKFMSDEWWEVTHTALKTAAELDIEIGIFNSPGWSQSGGPWVKPQQAMRYLAAVETHVVGPQKISVRLSPPKKNVKVVKDYLDAVDAHLSGTNKFSDRMMPLINDFQDVKVLAFPVQQGNRTNLFDVSDAKIECSANVTKTTADEYKLPTKKESSIGLTLPQAAVARSLMVYPGEYLSANCELQVKENDTFRSVKRFNINRTHNRPIQGYDPHAPIVASFPEINASEFRIVFSHVQGESVVASLLLTPTPIVERYPEKIMAKTASPYGDTQLADQTFSVQPNQVRDISDCLSPDGTITWEVPEGEWIIMRMGMTPTGVVNNPASLEATGLETDKTSRQHIYAHFDAFLGKLLERIPAADRKTWKVVVMDSYETGGQNFTDKMIDDFKKRYGYDPVPFFPVYQGYPVSSPELSDRFLWDVRRLIADKLANEYVAGLREKSHQHELTTWLENYGHWGFPGEFLQYGGQSDEVGGEFWDGGNVAEKTAAASCAHIYGKNKVWSESFTSSDPSYQRYPAMLKRDCDLAFAQGINANIFHVYIQQLTDNNYPGIDAWFSTEFNRKNTWFTHLDLFTQYIRRCNFMLQQGLNVADVAYFVGEDTPKMTGILQPKLPQGYNFDFINSEVILRDLQVQEERLILPHGTSYRLLVLPSQKTMRPEILHKIEKLVADGAVVLGMPPSRSPSLQNYPEADQQVQELAEKLWNKETVHKYGKGMILNKLSLEETFVLLKETPDCLTNNNAVRFTHRTFNGKEIYFLSNQSGKTIDFQAAFRVKNLQPELWDALTGEIRPLPAFEQNGKTTIVPLHLETNGSVFIVFRKNCSHSSPGTITANFPQSMVITAIDRPWQVSFEHDSIKRGALEIVTFTALKDWTQFDDERIRYYSGTAVYKTTLTTNSKIQEFKDSKIYLDLGKVNVMAKVKINGVYVGGVWTEPYRVDVTGHICDGENTLEIEVVNTWKNRLIGDQRLPEKDRRVKASYQWKPDSPLQKSGLIGPVTLLAIPFYH
jgi:hypothetical protein